MVAERIIAKLAELGIELPSPAPPVGSYTPWKRSGSQLWIAGMVPLREGTLPYHGLVGAEVSVEQAQECARVCALNGLAWLKQATDGFQGVTGLLRLNGFVASAPGFYEQPKVLNGASEFLAEVFGEKGKHTRIAIGVSELPLNATMQIDAIIEVE